MCSSSPPSPRSLEVILRAEAVEMVQAGDRCDFTGTLIVVPDVSQLQTAGARAESGSRVRGGGEGYDAEGVYGLKALGVRDLSYRMAFLACSVSTTGPGVSLAIVHFPLTHSLTHLFT